MNENPIINKINREIKVYINESKAISIKCRNKIVKMLATELDINIKLDNYENVDVVVTETGNLVIRDVEYKRATPLKAEEVEERFKSFQEKADPILKRREVNYYNMNDGKNVANLCIVIILVAIAVCLLIYAIKSFFVGNIINCIWLIAFISSWLTPKIKERFIMASNFIKRKLKK